ncbi:MAG: ribosome biogenesis GTP-binding protein YihA/YsxC [Bacteroidota bacterium]|nr:ribosome biogenesis GTP-binding protein YihA/YsxC [Bacteroidota bacterium]
MKIIKSVFEKSSSKISECPKGNLPEFALVGRSNVGKSSLINTLLNKKSIAKTSSKPGKTILINHFKINDKFYLVDLPGYGYARTSKQIIKEIKLIHKSYFKTRKQLLFTLLLIDSRHKLQKIDLEFMKYLNSMMCPFVIIFTKSDKIKSDILHEKIKLYKDSLVSHWEVLPETFVTSAMDNKGVDEILEFLYQSIKKYTI